VGGGESLTLRTILQSVARMPELATSVERDGRAAMVRLTGDLTIPGAKLLYAQLQDLARRRDVREIKLDFTKVGRIDSSAVAAVSLVGRQAKRNGKTIQLLEMAKHHRAAFAMAPRKIPEPDPEPQPTSLERIGDGVLAAWDGTKALTQIVKDATHQGAIVAVRRKKLPAGSVGSQLLEMGFNGVFIVAILAFLIGMTMAFQGLTQLQKLGAGVLVADMLGLSMVRELAPLMTAIILTGRTGAAIAAELGTMKVRSEIDALATMGINPTRFLIVPRIVALTIAGPALTLMAMFIGMVGGMVVVSIALDMPAISYWARIAEFVTLGDYAHGLMKSVLFSWIISVAGCHFGMRATGDSSSVGHATTRTVVVSVLFIIVVDAVFATVATVMRSSS
jgi:phospholipid/cholesterol/gamma-HCH transport system permease protein